MSLSKKAANDGEESGRAQAGRQTFHLPGDAGRTGAHATDVQSVRRMEDSNFRQLPHLLRWMRCEARVGQTRRDAPESGKVKESKGH